MKKLSLKRETLVVLDNPEYIQAGGLPGSQEQPSKCMECSVGRHRPTDCGSECN